MGTSVEGNKVQAHKEPFCAELAYMQHTEFGAGVHAWIFLCLSSCLSVASVVIAIPEPSCLLLRSSLTTRLDRGGDAARLCDVARPDQVLNISRLQRDQHWHYYI